VADNRHFGKTLNSDLMNFVLRTDNNEVVLFNQCVCSKDTEGLGYENLSRFLFMFTDEQERVQKKTFVNWINSYLSKVRTF
jgi:hypothetical protein